MTPMNEALTNWLTDQTDDDLKSAVETMDGFIAELCAGALIQRDAIKEIEAEAATSPAADDPAPL